MNNIIAGHEIAIIGMVGRFPGARDLSAFWQNLQAGVESISFFSEEELLEAGVDSALLKNPHYIKAGAIIDEIDLFDASFFNYSPREAEVMDPQQRLFLEHAWHALEQAGYDVEQYNGIIGVYAGLSTNSYLPVQMQSNEYLTKAIDSTQIMIGNFHDFLTTRVSYKLNLHGPSITLQTACSTSLVAIHMACESIRNGECDIALAGGVSIRLPQRSGYLYQEGGISSPDGHCRAFDAHAQGTVSGNGLGIIVLKRLTDALHDNDTILAVIKGSAVNNDGAAKVGYTAPSVSGQVEVVKMALEMADVHPQTIDYIETHGTGTLLGDLVEISALKKVFGVDKRQEKSCALGSVKTNIGHLDAAAGVVSVIKTVLMLKHKTLVPSLHFHSPNPQLELENSPFYVNVALRPWPQGEFPLRAGVSSFGIGGTNAHLIIEEAPHSFAPVRATSSWQLVVISAKTEIALSHVRLNLAAYLRQHPEIDLADVAHTLKVGRRAFECRQAIVCQDTASAKDILEAGDPKRMFSRHTDNTPRTVAFLFPGQGTQYIFMGRMLYQIDSIFRTEIDRCAQLLMPHLQLDIRTVLYPDEGHVQEAILQLDQTWLTQPVLFVFEYALCKVWEALGIRPSAMIGHSMGEYTAACLSEVFSLEDALQLVTARGRLMQQIAEGMMLGIPLSRSDIEQHMATLPPQMKELLSIAAINAPAQHVVSGPPEAVEALNWRLQTQGIHCQHLKISHVSHSTMVEPILEEFAAQVRAIALRPPKIRYISNVTGTWITTEQATDPNYWVKHLRNTVRFAEGIQKLIQEPDQLLLEVGPGHSLTTLVKLQVEREYIPNIFSSLPHRNDPQPDTRFLLTSLGNLWLAGAHVEWSTLYQIEHRHRLPLPLYPFERQHYWIDSDGQTDTISEETRTPRETTDLMKGFYTPSWRLSFLSTQLALAKEMASQQRHCWLLFIDASGLGKKFAALLTQRKQEVITVAMGDQFQQRNDYEYALNPQKPEDYRRLCKNLLHAQKHPYAIVHLWSITTDDPKRSDPVVFQQMQERGYYSLIFLIQALDREDFISPLPTATPLRIEVLSNNLHKVTDEEVIQPEKATLLGPCKVVNQEYDSVVCQCIDIRLPQADTTQEGMIMDQIVAEIVTESPHPMIAYRGTQRWVQVFEPLLLPDIFLQTPPFRPDGIYLITGGLGRVGLLLAEYIAKNVRAKIALISRSGLPERSMWKRWIESHDDQDEISRKIQIIQAIEDKGAEILVIEANVSSYEQMQRGIEQIEKHYGLINGVIHAAGATNDESVFRSMREVTVDQSQTQFLPKVQALYVLEEILQRRPLDFCLLFSSNASILGGVGLVSYAAANLFVDAFAASRHRNTNSSWISTNWDGWPRGEGEQLDKPLQTSIDQYTMTIDEATTAFAGTLSINELPQVIVSKGDFDARIKQWLQLRYTPWLTETEQVGPPQTLHNQRSYLTTLYVAPRSSLEHMLASIWQRLLGSEELGIYDNFFELGGHSLLVTQLLSLINTTFDVQISLRILFESNTIAQQAEIIEDALLEKIENLPEEEVQQYLFHEKPSF